VLIPEDVSRSSVRTPPVRTLRAVWSWWQGCGSFVIYMCPCAAESIVCDVGFCVLFGGDYASSTVPILLVVVVPVRALVTGPVQPCVLVRPPPPPAEVIDLPLLLGNSKHKPRCCFCAPQTA